MRKAAYPLATASAISAWSVLPLAMLALSSNAPAQMQPIPSTTHASTLDSGALHNAAGTEQVLFTQLVSFPQASWMRLVFADTTRLPSGSTLRLTGLLDGGIQMHRATSLAEWHRSSCFFNGGEVVVELIGSAGSQNNRVALEAVEVGAPTYSPESICGPQDNRVQSFQMNQGRLSVGCTGWLIGPANNGLDAALTAGHCVSGNPNQILELNVPNSTSGGSIIRAHPNDQYPFNVWNNSFLNGGVGVDYGVATVGRNSNTNQLPTERNGGSYYTLGPVPSSGQIRITGYGSSSIGNVNLVQKTHVGPYNSRTSTSISYVTDTTGGNSGSPIVNDATGFAVGIHTHGGCSSGGGANNGTRIDRNDLATAIDTLTRIPGTTRVFGVGCPAGSTLSFNAEPRIGTSVSALFTGLAANQPGTVIIGASSTNWLGLALPFDLSGLGATSCFLRVGYDIPLPVTTNFLSSLIFPINIPNDGALIGARAFMQLLYSHPGLNAASLGMTPAGEIQIGR